MAMSLGWLKKNDDVDDPDNDSNNTMKGMMTIRYEENTQPPTCIRSTLSMTFLSALGAVLSQSPARVTA